MVSLQTLMNAARSGDAASRLYRLIPKSRHKDLIRFAKSFGMSEAEVRNRMRMLRRDNA